MTYLSGFHAIEERIKSGLSCGALLVAKPGPRAREIVDLAIERKITVSRTGTADLDRLSGDHRGILLEVDEQQKGTGAVSLEGFIADLGDRKDALAVILDEITDPHNYGAILRSCDQFGADIVITRKRRIAKYADVIAKTSAGASAWVPTAEAPNLPRAVEILKEKGFWIYGADMEGEPCWSKDLRGRTAIILGGEGTGISRILKTHCDALISIPSLGKLDSLNVSVAAGVLFYEVMRQREQ
ncbi:MAG: 23S rRNA (guanosine(2251)-2'-O)-methyltransferase RlmB [Treponema sp.]|jgi:23S rRNA (guanosine2251-2'-O)-methyltransferase|nr:23S rRNA (guanosine(2251)-2'-O)-methyltransferase RlmB [Treponema sp.]